MRDLQADKEICDKAYGGPWEMNEYWRISNKDTKNSDGSIARAFAEVNANFIAAAREGWPEAIERAIAAEELLIYVYPYLAGRVIQLQQSGEEKAAGEWDDVAKMVYKAIEGRK